MSILNAELYDALKEAGTSEITARKAAEAVTGYDNKFSKIENELVAIHGEINLLKWMMGFTLAIVTAIALKLFLH